MGEDEEVKTGLGEPKSPESAGEGGDEDEEIVDSGEKKEEEAPSVPTGALTSLNSLIKYEDGKVFNQIDILP